MALNDLWCADVPLGNYSLTPENLRNRTEPNRRWKMDPSRITRRTASAKMCDVSRPTRSWLCWLHLHSYRSVCVCVCVCLHRLTTALFPIPCYSNWERSKGIQHYYCQTRITFTARRHASAVYTMIRCPSGHFRPYRSTTYVDAAYCYRHSSVVCRSVDLCKNGWSDRTAVWVVDLGGSKEPCIRCDPDTACTRKILREGAAHCKIQGPSAVSCAITAEPMGLGWAQGSILRQRCGLFCQITLTTCAVNDTPPECSETDGHIIAQLTPQSSDVGFLTTKTLTKVWRGHRQRESQIQIDWLSGV